MFDKVLKFVGSVQVHRAAAAVVIALVGIQAFVQVHGVDFGLDQNTIQVVLSVVAGATVVAREFVSPVILPFVVGLFKTTGA
jgi:hypothetical protein